jgi:hypothetical protein
MGKLPAGNRDVLCHGAGEVEFTVYDETFVAYPECVVKIPKFASHSIVAKTKSIMYDIAGKTLWYAFLQDRSSILHYTPERAKDPETMAALKKKYGCMIEKIGRK